MGATPNDFDGWVPRSPLHHCDVNDGCHPELENAVFAKGGTYNFAPII
jgi:hypothetical protein